VRVGQTLTDRRELVCDMLYGHPLAGRQRVEITLRLQDPSNIWQNCSSLGLDS
jgi:hypothetical protein